MATVTHSRTFDAPPADVRDRVRDVGAFMRASGFDAVAVDGQTIHLENQVGILTIEMTVRQIDRDDAVLAYEQVSGLFDEMVTSYAVEAVDEGTRVTAETSFSLGVAVVGDVLDGTVITRQRRRELEAQFDWLEAQLG